MGKRYSELLNIASWLDFIVGSWLCIDTASGAKKIPAEMLSSLKHLQVESNDEFLYAVSDSNGRFLFGIQSDGSVEWTKGIPEPVREMFSRVFEILNTKVDKEDGKSLISKTFADGVSIVSNDEYLYAIVDPDGRFLFGIQRDGSVEWTKGIPESIQDAVDSILSELSQKVDKEAGKSLINSIFAEGLTVTTTDDYLLLVTDSEDRVVFSIDKSGKIEQLRELEEVVQKKVAGKTVINEIFSNGVSITSDEFHLFVIQDSVGRILLSVDSTGKVEQIEELRGVFQGKEAGKSVINKQFADGVSITFDNNNLIVVTDREGRVLFNITNDGTIPQIIELVKDKVDKEAGYSLVPKFIRDLFTVSSDENHLLILNDAAGRLILDITKDGRLELTKDIPSIVDALSKKVDKERGKGLIDNRFEAGLSYPVGNYLHLIVDAIGRFITGIRGDGSIDFGTKVNFLQGVNWSSENLTDLQKALAENGINISARNQSDWSNAKSVHIQPPRLSIVNIEMMSALPQYKGDEKTGHIEFWDLNGNYFKKKITIDVQGNSTQWFPKKNFAIDLLNEDDTEFSLKFGDWPEQDSYHIKAWWVDMFRGLGQVYYELLDEMWAYKRGPLNRPWMQAIVSSERLTNRGYGCEYNYQPDSLDSRIDSGAKCHPLGFPVLVYHNGDFYGVSSFAMKKHRKNYHMNKKTYNEIIVDGVLRVEEFWSGENSIDWTSFELRNPKTLITMSGGSYDGDNPQELIDNTSPAWTASKDQKNTQKTKNYIKAFSNVMPQIEAAVIQYGVDSQEVIDLYNQYFNVDNLIDYILFSDVILDTDTGANNVLWTTWDGVRWYACPYDLDRSCGMWQGFLTGNAGSALLVRRGLPTYYIGQNATFRSRLEARYHELRDGGVFTQDHLWSFAKRWSDSIGVDNYTEEFKRWPQNIVNANAEINTDYWDIVLVDELPVMSSTGDWSDSTAYNIGDFAFYGPGDVNGLGTASGYYKFVCTSPNTNQPPIKTLKCKDSLWRLYAWFGYQLRAMDLFYNYSNN